MKIRAPEREVGATAKARSREGRREEDMISQCFDLVWMRLRIPSFNSTTLEAALRRCAESHEGQARARGRGDRSSPEVPVPVFDELLSPHQSQVSEFFAFRIRAILAALAKLKDIHPLPPS